MSYDLNAICYIEFELKGKLYKAAKLTRNIDFSRASLCEVALHAEKFQLSSDISFNDDLSIIISMMSLGDWMVSSGPEDLQTMKPQMMSILLRELDNEWIRSDQKHHRRDWRRKTSISRKGHRS